MAAAEAPRYHVGKGFLTDSQQQVFDSDGVVIHSYPPGTEFPSGMGVQPLLDYTFGGAYQYYVLFDLNKFAGVEQRDFDPAKDPFDTPRSPGTTQQVLTLIRRPASGAVAA